MKLKAPNEELFEAKNQAILYAKLLNIEYVLILNGLKNENKFFFIRNKKIRDIFEVYKKTSDKEKIKNENIKTINSITSNKEVNLHNKINKVPLLYSW